MKNKAAKRYLARVKRGLLCEETKRIRLLAQLGKMIEDFQQENPEGGYAELTVAFGNPNECADELLSSLGKEEVEVIRKKRRRMRWGMVAVTLIVLTFTSIFWWMKYNEEVTFNSHITIIEGPAFDLTEEEYNAAKEWAVNN